MANIGTYGTGYSPFVFDKVLPEPGDNLTFDWMESVSQFSQRFIKIATSQATLGNGSTWSLSYSSLNCDFFPPFIKVYSKDPTTGWRIFNDIGIAGGYIQIGNITLTGCDILNSTGGGQTLYAIVYL